jgi:hypothetical protein
MATQFNSTTAAAFLRKMYSLEYITNTMASVSSPLLGMMKKKTDGSGKSYNFLGVVDELVTGSAIFSTAQTLAANSSATIGGQYECAWCPSYEPVRVGDLLIAQTRNDENAWGPALKKATDSALRVATHRLGIRLYTQGWGELAQVKTGSVSGATFKCKVAGHVYRFLPGMPIVGSSSLNAATLRSATALTVSSVDYDTGVITLSDNLSTPGITDEDWLFVDGDRHNSSSPTRRCPTGLGAWIPTTRPPTDATITTLHGVTRSTNSRNYGNYVDGTAQSEVDALIQCAQLCSSLGGARKLYAVVAPTIFSKVSKALGSDRRYVDIPGGAGYAGFSTIAIMADGINVPLVVDRLLGEDLIYLVDPGQFELVSVGPAPHIDTDDGKTMCRIADDSGVEIRVRSFSAMAIKNPAAFGVIQLV